MKRPRRYQKGGVDLVGAHPLISGGGCLWNGAVREGDQGTAPGYGVLYIRTPVESACGCKLDLGANKWWGAGGNIREKMC